MENKKNNVDSATENYRKPFPTVLRKLLEGENGKEVKQTEVAEAIGVTRQAISNYARGITTPDIDTFVQIADYFNVSYDYLLGKTEAKKRENIDFCEALGLSERSVFRILNFKQIRYNEVFDQMLCNSMFFDVMHQVARGVNFIKQFGSKNMHAIVPQGDFEKLQKGEMGEAAFVETSEITGMYITRAAAHFTRLVEEVFNDYEKDQKSEGSDQ